MLLLIVVFDITSILTCYFYCGIKDKNEQNVKDAKRSRKISTVKTNKIPLIDSDYPPEVLEEGAAESLLVKSIMRVDNKENDD